MARRSVILSEVGDGLVVGGEPAGQPHQLDVAPRLPLQPPARLHAVQVAVDVELEQQRRMIGRPPRRRRDHAGEAERTQVELIDEDVDHSDRVLFGHVVVEASSAAGDPRPQRSESSPRLPIPLWESTATPAFLHSLGRKRPGAPYHIGDLQGRRGASPEAVTLNGCSGWMSRPLEAGCDRKGLRSVGQLLRIRKCGRGRLVFRDLTLPDPCWGPRR